MYNLSTEEPILKEAEERQARILDADYSAVDIEGYVDKMEAAHPRTERLIEVRA